MDLFKKCLAVKINKTNHIDGIVIENNLDIKIDKLGSIITNVFLANEIENIKYENYSNSNNGQRKLIISISNKAYEENKGKLPDIINSITNVINNCDADNNLISVNVSNERLTTVFPPLNTIEISDEFMEKYDIDENQNINLMDLKSGIIKICCAKYNEKLKENFIALNPSHRNVFTHSNQIFIQKISNVNFNKVTVQNVNHILEGLITISEDKRDWIKKQGSSQFELINEITGASMDIGVDKIKYSKLDKDIIKMNYFQRLVLECDLPQTISNYRYEKFKSILENR